MKVFLFAVTYSMSVAFASVDGKASRVTCDLSPDSQDVHFEISNTTTEIPTVALVNVKTDSREIYIDSKRASHLEVNWNICDSRKIIAEGYFDFGYVCKLNSNGLHETRGNFHADLKSGVGLFQFHLITENESYATSVFNLKNCHEISE